MTAVLDATAGVDVASGAVEKAAALGADEVQVSHVFSDLFEITYDKTDVTMVRTTVEDQVSITVYVGSAKGQASLTGRAPDLVDQGVREAIAAAQAGLADPANGVTSGPPTERTERGDREPDKDSMLDVVVRHQQHMCETYPAIVMRDSTYQFRNTWRSFANSAGVRHQERRSGYAATSIFSAREGAKATSFNYTSAAAPTPFAELIEVATLRDLLDATLRSLEPKAVPGTFVGDVIFTPDSLGTLLEPVIQALSGYTLMKGTSPFQDALGATIAAPMLTVASRPCSTDFLAPSFDGDGVPSSNLSIIAKGALENHLIDWYTSRKLDRAMTAGTTAFDVAPGDKTFDELVASTERGIILGRFSGGTPNPKLDFSGVAKNSFYVEDGQVRHAVQETMIAGNFGDLLQAIRAVGAVSVNFGGHRFPAVATSGATISTK
ncbi:MAG TPA: TldD/PmbA family protein [Acidimicrobiales bacterium]|nr:TldD/PmbA family protein [Acidimicrobiales bacterium]